MSKPSEILKVSEWEPASMKLGTVRKIDNGATFGTIISKQSNKPLNLETPFMMTWGIADYVNDKGESDGKYTLSLNFPSDDYVTSETTMLLEKLIDFEEKIIDMVAENSMKIFGEIIPISVLKYTMSSIIKRSNIKDTKNKDFSKPPSIKPKIQKYEANWKVDIFDMDSNLIFPNKNDNTLSPIDFIPKMSNVACVLSLSQIWYVKPQWGCTLKVIQCVVKPRNNVEVITGKCRINMNNATHVDDSDDEMEAAEVNETEIEEPVVVKVEVKEPVVVKVEVKEPVVVKVEVKEPVAIKVEVKEPVAVKVEVKEPVAVKEEIKVPDAEEATGEEPVKVTKKTVKKADGEVLPVIKKVKKSA